MPKEHPYSKEIRVVNKHQFRRLFACPSWKEIEMRLRAGGSIASCVKTLVERKEYVGIKYDSLYRQIHRYVKTLPVAEQLRRPYVDEAVEKLTVGLNEVREMELLIGHQMQRIGIDSKLETKMNKLLASHRGEITALFDMLERLIRIKQELGLLPTMPRKNLIGVAVAGDGGPTLRDMLQIADGDVNEGGILRLIGQAFRQTQTKQLPSGQGE